MEGYRVPDSDELISIFGCECNIDSEYNQRIEFLDSNQNKLILIINLIIDSVIVQFLYKETVVYQSFFEGLAEFQVFEDSQSLRLVFLENKYLTLEIKVWPEIYLKLTGMINE